MKAKYDYLIVGAGLFGAMFAHKVTSCGLSCLVIDKNKFVGGGCYTELRNGIHVHKFGPHIFHTNSKEVWDFVNSIAEFEPFINMPIAKSGGSIYSLPFNLHTFNQIYGVTTPDELKALVDGFDTIDGTSSLEEFAISKVGKKVYEILIKGYTEKQWGVPCSQLPASIIKRLPIRDTFNSNYFNDSYQGVPKNGYTDFIERLLSNADVKLGVDFFDDRAELMSVAEEIVYTGSIDQYFDYRFGRLDYRSLRFEHKEFPETENYQGNAVINHTDLSVPYTRSIEHKHFNPHTKAKGTIVTFEYPQKYVSGATPYYPIPTAENMAIYARYKDLAYHTPHLLIGGRLAEYQYLNMNDIVERFLWK